MSTTNTTLICFKLIEVTHNSIYKKMEVKKYNPFVIKPPAKSNTKPKPKSKLETRGLFQRNKKKLGTIYANGLVKTSSKKFD